MSTNFYNLGKVSRTIFRVKKKLLDKWTVQGEDSVLILQNRSISLACDECGDEGRIWEDQEGLILFFCSFECQRENKTGPPKFNSRVKYHFYPNKRNLGVLLSALAIIVAALFTLFVR